jgi:hypothetical protein
MSRMVKFGKLVGQFLCGQWAMQGRNTRPSGRVIMQAVAPTPKAWGNKLNSGWAIKPGSSISNAERAEARKVNTNSHKVELGLDLAQLKLGLEWANNQAKSLVGKRVRQVAQALTLKGMKAQRKLRALIRKEVKAQIMGLNNTVDVLEDFLQATWRAAAFDADPSLRSNIEQKEEELPAFEQALFCQGVLA